jgi:hypothetical protein
VGTWVGGLATGAAFLVTSAVFTLQLRDRRKEQARLVAVWRADDLSFSEHGERRFKIHCKNGSSEPIYSTVVFGDTAGRRICLGVAGVVAPTQEQVIDVSLPLPETPLPGVHFYDAAGRAWCREPSGALANVSWEIGTSHFGRPNPESLPILTHNCHAQAMRSKLSVLGRSGDRRTRIPRSGPIFCSGITFMKLVHGTL